MPHMIMPHILCHISWLDRENPKDIHLTIFLVRELIRNNMRPKPKLYYTHLGKSHYTYGERAFYCPACDQQFQSIDEYHKHVAQVCRKGTL